MSEKIMYENQSAVFELNKVDGFKPKKFLIKNPAIAGAWDLPLKIKKLWFRLKHKDGRLIVKALQFNEQVAVVEAKVFFGKSDTEAVASYVAQTTRDTHGEMYIQTAQYIAASEALNDAGFGCQFSDLQADIEPELPKLESAITPVEEIEADENGSAEIISAEAAETADVEVVEVDNAKLLDEMIEFVEPNEVVADETMEATTESRFVGMSVDEIRETMTLDEALAVVVDVGYCTGWTLEKVVQMRPASLKWYVSNYQGNNNELRAGAAIILESDILQQAS